MIRKDQIGVNKKRELLAHEPTGRQLLSPSLSNTHSLLSILSLALVDGLDPCDHSLISDTIVRPGYWFRDNIPPGILDSYRRLTVSIMDSWGFPFLLVIKEQLKEIPVSPTLRSVAYVCVSVIEQLMGSTVHSFCKIIILCARYHCKIHRVL